MVACHGSFHAWAEFSDCDERLMMMHVLLPFRPSSNFCLISSSYFVIF
jgi:hypothetical protein